MSPSESGGPEPPEGLRTLAAAGRPRAEAMPVDLERVKAEHGTVAGRIRALHARGYSRADIARLLGKRYQHVRNVLEGDNLRIPDPGPGVAEAPGACRAHEPDATVSDDVVRLRVRPDGSVLLPPEVLEHLQARFGGVVVGELSGDGELLLRGPHAAMRHIWTLIEPWKPGEPLASEELISDRREEERREREGG